MGYELTHDRAGDMRFITVTGPFGTEHYRTNQDGEGLWQLRGAQWRQVLGTTQFDATQYPGIISRLTEALEVRDTARRSGFDPAAAAAEIGCWYLGP